MPKASFRPEDAVLTSVGLQEGNVEVIAAKALVHQYPPNKKTGQQGDPFMCVQLELMKLDEDFSRTEDEPVTLEYSCGKLAKFHPGLAENREDDEPADQGTDLGAEGNVVFAVDGAAFDQRSKFIKLTNSMVDCGFKPEVLAAGWLPDLIGTKGHLHSVPGTKIEGQTYERDPMVVVFDKITTFPYEKKGKTAAKPPVKTAPVPVKGQTKPAHTTAPAPADDDNSGLVAFIFTKAVEAYRATNTESVPRKDFQQRCHTFLMREKWEGKPISPRMHPAVMGQIKNDDALQKMAAAAEVAVDFEEGTLIFTPAE
jgi:hypothetical protein